MSNTQRGVLYFIVIQASFVFSQLLGTFGGYFQLIGLFLVVPLLVTELHYRFMVAKKLELGPSIKLTLKMFLIWGVLNSALFGVILAYLNTADLTSFLLSEPLSILAMKQMLIVGVSLFASLLMYIRISSLLSLRNASQTELMNA